eukprot:4952324-Alexandrium_andersonii.AAC.1
MPPLVSHEAFATFEIQSGLPVAHTAWWRRAGPGPGEQKRAAPCVAVVRAGSVVTSQLSLRRALSIDLRAA